jgi:hypothetical protein
MLTDELGVDPFVVILQRFGGRRRISFESGVASQQFIDLFGFDLEQNRATWCHMLGSSD